MKRPFKTIGLVGKANHVETSQTLCQLYQFLTALDYEVLVEEMVGNNLTGKEILNNSQVFVANAGYLKAPRTITLQGIYRFGD